MSVLDFFHLFEVFVTFNKKSGPDRAHIAMRSPFCEIFDDHIDQGRALPQRTVLRTCGGKRLGGQEERGNGSKSAQILCPLEIRNWQESAKRKFLFPIASL